MRAARFELSGPAGVVILVEVAKGVEHLALFGLGPGFGTLEVEDWGTGRAEDRTLIGRRHVAARPVLGAADRPAGRVEHHHEAGEVLVDAAEPVVDPRTQTGAAGQDLAGVHLEHGRAVDRRVGRHRVQEGDVVDAGGQVREQVADVLAGLAVLLELPLRPDDPALVLLAASAERLDGDRLAVELVELGLVVEGVDLAGTAVHEEEDDALGPGRQHRLLGGQRVGERARLAPIGGGSEVAVLAEEPSQAPAR